MIKTRNRLIAVGIALLVLIAAALFIIPQKTASAESWIDSATEFAGNGSQGTPYRISSAAELAYLAKMVNGGETYDGKFFELTANIDLGGKEWTPIGTKDNQFLGKFNGNGKTISNLTISGGDNLGLFAYSSGEIKSVYLDNVDITTSLNAGNAGGVCAFNNGTIDGCGVLSGAIRCASSNGGQLGGISKENSGTISRCFSNAAIKGANSAGIVYVNRGNGVVQNCYNAGTIEGLSTAGGISNNNYGKITTCLNLGEIIAKDVSDEDGYVEIRGFGICAMNQPGASLENCYSDSDVCPKELFGGFRNTTVYYKTTAELCDSSFLSDLNSNWESGSESGETNGRYRTAIYTYPSLKGVGTAATRKGGQTYDFSVGAIGKKFEDFTYIETAEDFKNIANNLSGNYVLKNDIDFNGEVIEPIGDAESVTGSGLSMPFSGNFSGDGHKILNVTVKRELGSHSGLFGANKGTIINLAVEADVSGTAYVGGICASNESGGRIADCSFSGTVNGTKSYVGGICGENKGGILRCAADGTVNGDSSVGGICGSNSGGDIENCINLSEVTRNSSSGNIGGIVGESVKSTTNSTVSYCISIGKTADTHSTYIGGVCGYAYGAQITNSYFDSEVSAGLKAIYDAFDDRDTETLKGLTTAGLSGELPTDFADTVWQAGRSEVTDIDGRAGTRTATYISLKNVGTPEVLESTPVYNFSLDGTVTWETYEPVASVEDFRKIDENLSGNYVLARNIDFGGNNYRPIAYKTGTSFTGKFSGNGHTISNIRVKYDDDLVGLFGTNKGLIMNLAVSGEVTGEEYIGGICAKNEGTIYSCSFDGEVKQSVSTQRKGKVGGICGTNYATISNCFNSADVSGKDYIGGICGEMFGNDPVVVYCISVGKVSGFTGSAIVGGICGYGIGVSYGGSSELSHCRFDMDVSGSINLINSGGAITKRDDNFSYNTEFLCGDNIGSFDPDIWNAAKGVVVTPDAKDGKFGTKTCYYMSLKCFGESVGVSSDVFNFAFAGGSDDWQPYTLISSEDVFRTYWQWDVKWSENFVLGDDITLAYSLAPNDLIPTSLSTGTFSGMFSGNGHTVTLTDDSTCGLFGTNRGTIINLAVKGNIDSSAGSSMSNYSGGICAVNDGTIYGCSFDGKIYGGANNTGAVCGCNNGTISNCFALANVKATNGQVGGIAALGKEDSELQDCYFVGTVTTNANGLGVISVTSSKNCYYNKEVCQFAEEESGTALTTLEMTSYGALAKMNFTDDIWEKRLNDTENGIAYYPSFKGSTYVPSVKYDKKLELNREGDKEPVYGDDIEFTLKALITFENDFYGEDITAEDPNGSFKVLVGSETEPIVLLGKTFKHRADTAGNVTFKLIYNGSGYFPENYSESFVIKIGKKKLTAADFTFAPASDLTFDNTLKAASVKPKSKGFGEITVKYYDESGKEAEPINAGTYTVKIDVAEGGNNYAAKDLTADTWKFTIAKAAALTLPDIKVSYRWSTDKDITVSVAGLPENMGKVTVDGAKKDGTIVAGIFPNACYSDGKFTFHLGPNTVGDIGKTGSFTIKLTADNYEGVTFTVKVTLTDKDNQEAPDPAAFDVVFTNDGSELIATIKTALKGVEYSFDGTTWSDANTTTVAHNVEVTAYIRYKETDEKNASAPVSKTVNSGHGTLTHHDAVKATCQNDGNTEYWECKVCAKYYSDEAATTEIALADTIIAKTGHKWSVTYSYDKDGHWHKCEYCDAATATESHVSSGEATATTAEYCTVCGYVITPRKDGNSGGQVNGGGGGGGRDDSTNTNPAINGIQKSWEDIAADLSKQNGDTAVITLNGKATVPAEVIKVIADNRIKVEFVYDSAKSWLVDGSEIKTVSAVDFSMRFGSIDTVTLRGVSGGKYRISVTNVPAELKAAFRKQYAGEFANVYKLVDGKLVFRTCVKLAADGTAVISGMDAAGEYAVMICKYSDRPGDINNDGILNSGDALALLRYSVGLEEYENLWVGDYNDDGKIDIADARAVLRWSVGLTA